MAYAVGANIVLRMWVRRFLHAACAARGEALVIPETAREMMGRHYQTLSTGRSKLVAWELWQRAPGNRGRTGTDDETMEEITALQAHIMMGWSVAFEKWMEAEPQRNDSYWRIAPRTRQSKMTAIALRLAGVWTGYGAHDGMYGEAGEDAQVLAEAMECGAKWIVSGYLGKGMRQGLNEDIADVARKTGLAVTGRFIATAEEAVEELAGPLSERNGGENGYDLRTQLAYLVARNETLCERNHQDDAKRLNRMIRGLARGGLERTARAIAGCQAQDSGWTGEEVRTLENETTELARRVRPAVESDARRRAAEGKAMRDVAENISICMTLVRRGKQRQGT